jgi:hypothetical protein
MVFEPLQGYWCSLCPYFFLRDVPAYSHSPKELCAFASLREIFKVHASDLHSLKPVGTPVLHP